MIPEKHWMETIKGYIHQIPYFVMGTMELPKSLEVLKDPWFVILLENYLGLFRDLSISWLPTLSACGMICFQRFVLINV